MAEACQRVHYALLWVRTCRVLTIHSGRPRHDCATQCTIGMSLTQTGTRTGRRIPADIWEFRADRHQICPRQRGGTGRAFGCARCLRGILHEVLYWPQPWCSRCREASMRRPETRTAPPSPPTQAHLKLNQPPSIGRSSPAGFCRWTAPMSSWTWVRPRAFILEM